MFVRAWSPTVVPTKRNRLPVGTSLAVAQPLLTYSASAIASVDAVSFVEWQLAAVCGYVGHAWHTVCMLF
jgi:hypothetical protein